MSTVFPGKVFTHATALLLEQGSKRSGVDVVEPPASSGGIAYPLYAELLSVE